MTNYYNSSYSALDKDMLGLCPTLALSLMSLDLKAERALMCHSERERVEQITSSVHWYTAGPGDIMADLQLLQGLCMCVCVTH